MGSFPGHTIFLRVLCAQGNVLYPEKVSCYQKSKTPFPFSDFLPYHAIVSLSHRLNFYSSTTMHCSLGPLNISKTDEMILSLASRHTNTDLNNSDFLVSDTFQIELINIEANKQRGVFTNPT